LDKARLTKVNKPEPESHAIKNVETTLSCIVSHFEGVDIHMKIYLSGEDNFRSAIAETYKAHRADAERPYHLDACKNYLWDTYLAEAQDGLEADDLMGIRACILHALPADYCICTTDKDLMGIPGCHYNWVTGQERLMSEREADLFFYTQLLTGDTTDNIPGLKGCGPKGAQRILKKFYDDPKLISTKALYSTVLDAYIAEETRLHGADEKLSPRNIWELAKANLVCNAQQLWILREPFVMWQPPRFVASDFVGGSK
jgi:DNA polymerase-1